MRRRYLNNLYTDKGLIHLWRLDESLDDEVGEANGYPDGDITFHNGILSKCVLLENSSNIIVNLDLELDKWTVQCWVKHIGTPVDYSALIFHRYNSGNCNGINWCSNSRNTFEIIGVGGYGTLGFDYGNPTEWQLYTMTSDGSNLRCFINGVEKSPIFTDKTISKSLKLKENTRIGRDTYSSSRNIHGYLSQLTIWSKPLDKNDILSFYNNGNGILI